MKKQRVAFRKLRVTQQQARGLIAWMLIAQSFLQLHLLNHSTMNKHASSNNSNSSIAAQLSTTKSNLRIQQQQQLVASRPDDWFPKGILSASESRLRSLQREVDKQNNTERCLRYGFLYNSTAPKHRRIFFGSNVAGETWELFEIVAAEAYGIFEGMVYVKSNRTIDKSNRRFRRHNRDRALRRLFGANQVQVRSFIGSYASQGGQENPQLFEIILGWKEMGMTADDIGYLSDADETFSRDFLRAVQVCDGIEAFDYESHRCGRSYKLLSSTRIFEMTPECTAENTYRYHPDMMVGACIEMIGNETMHPMATRNEFARSKGFDNSCIQMRSETDRRYSLWTPYDLIFVCGGDHFRLDDQPSYCFTGYRFRKSSEGLRAKCFKYFSYAHFTFSKPLKDFNKDVRFSVNCIENVTEWSADQYKRVSGGFEALKPSLPLFFLQKTHRQRKHAKLNKGVSENEKKRTKLVVKNPWPFLSERSKQSIDDASVGSVDLVEEAVVYPDDGFPRGILSNTSISRLRSLQRAVDEQDHAERCRRYGFFYNSSAPKSRRIFYGSNIATEPWELLAIVAAEAHGIFEGMVYVEANRTHNFVPRPFCRLNHDGTLRQLFGTQKVQVRAFVNDDKRMVDLERDNMQRYEILKGWKEMGMTVDDIGYIADADETFSRDFFRAAQVCDGIEAFEYEKHRCGQKAKLVSATRVFEMTPECTSENRVWYHPDMMLGACIELIGNETLNPVSARESGERVKGFGSSCVKMTNETDRRYPLWTPYDFKLLCGGDQVRLNNWPNYDFHTGYHFHNFFADFRVTRFKYFSYAHPDPLALVKSLEELNPDVKFAVRCITNRTKDPKDEYERVIGGFDALRPTLPLYFFDEKYRQQRHADLKRKVEADEKERLEVEEKMRQLRRTWPFLSESQKRNSDIADANSPHIYEKAVVYPEDGFPRGILSNMSTSRLRSLQRAVDEQNHTERCRRYGFVYNSSSPKNRRIFFGSIIADEPWELFEIVAAEAFGILEGMVYVESDRSIDKTYRHYRRLNHKEALRRLFSARQLLVRRFVSENVSMGDYLRQRNEIVKGWKEMGMTVDDIGYIADAEETFSRDFLRAVQVCDGIDAFDYDSHRCGRAAKLLSSTRVFEMTPECTAEDQNWYHPDMLLGACIEMIGNEMLNPVAARKGLRRLRRFGDSCIQMISETDRRYPLWTPYDFRFVCGLDQVRLIDQPNYDFFTGYRFHNFFTDLNATRFKNRSYKNNDAPAFGKALEKLGEDIKFATRCVKNLARDPKDQYKRVIGGFEVLKPTFPLYFLDERYRETRHEIMKRKVEGDKR